MTREYFSELIRYRSLISALVVRHLAARYRGSVLGFLWSFLNPLCLMAVYTLVFRYYVRFDQVENYTIFLFCGLLPWIWLSSGLIEGTSAISSSGHLITKSMFPPHLLPTVAVITSFVHFVLSLPLLFLFMVLAGIPFSFALLILPIVLLVQFVLVQGLALALSSLNVLFRDVQHLVANILTLLFFLCPILYPITVVPEEFRFTMDYNPLAALTRMYQVVILEGQLPMFSLWCMATGAAVVSLLFGLFVYERNRESFAELL